MKETSEKLEKNQKNAKESQKNCKKNTKKLQKNYKKTANKLKKTPRLPVQSFAPFCLLDMGGRAARRSCASARSAVCACCIFLHCRAVARGVWRFEGCMFCVAAGCWRAV